MVGADVCGDQHLGVWNCKPSSLLKRCLVVIIFGKWKSGWDFWPSKGTPLSGMGFVILDKIEVNIWSNQQKSKICFTDVV